MTTFSGVPIRQNGKTVDASWVNLLRAAGINIENLLGNGFLPETRFSLTNGQATPANVTGMVFDHTLYTSIRVDMEINQKTATNELIANGTLVLMWRALSSSWDPVFKWDGDDPGIAFTVTAGGQVQYTLGTLAGSSYVGTLKFKATTFNI